MLSAQPVGINSAVFKTLQKNEVVYFFILE